MENQFLTREKEKKGKIKEKKIIHIFLRKCKNVVFFPPFFLPILSTSVSSYALSLSLSHSFFDAFPLVGKEEP